MGQIPPVAFGWSTGSGSSHRGQGCMSATVLDSLLTEFGGCIYIYNIYITVQIRHECCTRWMQFVLIVIVCYEGAWEFMFSVFWTFMPDSAWLSLSFFLWKGDIHLGRERDKRDLRIHYVPQ